MERADQINIRIEPEIKKQLIIKAREIERPLSEMVRIILKESLKNEFKNN